MSRYTIPAPHAAHHVVVGFDGPLETFFVQVDDASVPDHEDHLIYWQGTRPGEIPTVAALVDAVRPYATLRPEDQARLQQDYDHREPPTPLQQWMGRLLHHVNTMSRHGATAPTHLREGERR